MSSDAFLLSQEVYHVEDMGEWGPQFADKHSQTCIFTGVQVGFHPGWETFNNQLDEGILLDLIHWHAN